MHGTKSSPLQKIKINAQCAHLYPHHISFWSCHCIDYWLQFMRAFLPPSQHYPCMCVHMDKLQKMGGGEGNLDMRVCLSAQRFLFWTWVLHMQSRHHHPPTPAMDLCENAVCTESAHSPPAPALQDFQGISSLGAVLKRGGFQMQNRCCGTHGAPEPPSSC